MKTSQNLLQDNAVFSRQGKYQKMVTMTTALNTQVLNIKIYKWKKQKSSNVHFDRKLLRQAPKTWQTNEKYAVNININIQEGHDGPEMATCIQTHWRRQF